MGRDLLLVITGAGASAASGIPTFRGTDPDAIWQRDVTELATRRFFEQDPVSSWRWYLRRFGSLQEARPNDAHRALAALESWQQEQGGRFLLVTQNIDTLHEEAGSQELVKVHGSSDRLRCSRDGCELAAPMGSLRRRGEEPAKALEAFAAAPSRQALPRCPACGAVLRPHVLWFDELYTEHADYQFDRVRRELDAMALVLFVGTSFSVGITEMALQSGAAGGIPMISIDPAHRIRIRGLTLLDAQAEEILPAACRHLGVPLR